MIEEPPLLTVQRPRRRPSQSQIDGFKAVPTSFVVDAMQGGQVLDRLIRPLVDDPAVSIAGPALTADNGPADILALLAALPFVAAGDVVLSAAYGHQGCAAMGDRVAAFAKNAGAAAIVTDGPARDYAGIKDVGLPIWCTGLCPNTPHGNGPGKVGTPILVGGQRVETGDMIVADYDGVVVVPFEQIDSVLEKLTLVKALETELDAKLKDGLRAPEAITALLETDKVTFLG